MQATVVHVAAVALLMLAVAVRAEIATIETCPEETACTVHEVRITGCRQFANGVCKIKRGQSAEIAFDYTADFAAEAANGQVYWVSPERDLPFVGMETNACLHTACPLVSGARQTYTYTFETSRKYQAVSSTRENGSVV